MPNGGDKHGKPSSIDSAPILTRWHTHVREAAAGQSAGLWIPATILREFKLDIAGTWRASVRQVSSRRAKKVVIVMEPL